MGKRVKARSIPKAREDKDSRLPFSTLTQISSELDYEENRYFSIKFRIKRLEEFDFRAYSELRNRLNLDGTSKPSSYIRFGVISLKKIYWKAVEQVGLNCQFIKELARREFWYHIKHYFPEVKNLEFQEKGETFPGAMARFFLEPSLKEGPAIPS